MTKNNNPNNFSDNGFWAKLSKSANAMGAKLVYNVLVLYYLMKAPGVPMRVKAEIVGALAYVILPVDLIPDFLPGGFTDDLGAVAFAVSQVIDFVTPDVQRQARDKVRDIFGSSDGCNLAA